MHYNPFAYIRSEKDILKAGKYHYRQHQRRRRKIRRGFLGESGKAYLLRPIGYIWYEAPEHEKNFTTLLEMINASEAREDDPEFQSPVTSCLTAWKKKTRTICGEPVQIRFGAGKTAKAQSSFPAVRGLPL